MLIVVWLLYWFYCGVDGDDVVVCWCVSGGHGVVVVIVVVVTVVGCNHSPLTCR